MNSLFLGLALFWSFVSVSHTVMAHANKTKTPVVPQLLAATFWAVLHLLGGF